MNDIFNELIALKEDIAKYLNLKKEDFNSSRGELIDVSRFSTVENCDRLSQIIKGMEESSNMYRNAKNFLSRLESISNGVDINSDENDITACIGLYLQLKYTTEYKLVISEMEKRFNENKSKGL